MDRTRSNLTLAALLLAVGYIVGQAVGPRGADAGVSHRPTGEPVVTVADDNPTRIVVWNFAAAGGLEATSYRLAADPPGQHAIETVHYTRRVVGSTGR
ncbi:MAG: hypothetical protein KDB73_14955 [Planctomycetes bacterium]|nr:hypothetical protein [Planctomycetota bacterium]